MLIILEVIVTSDQCWFRLVDYNINIACTNICNVAREFLHAKQIGVPKYKIIPKLKIRVFYKEIKMHELNKLAIMYVHHFVQFKVCKYKLKIFFYDIRCCKAIIRWLMHKFICRLEHTNNALLNGIEFLVLGMNRSTGTHGTEHYISIMLHYVIVSTTKNLF